MPVPDPYPVPKPLPQRANALEKVHVPHSTLRHSLTCSFSRQVTIGSLSDEVLLNIFRYYLDASPQFWPRLVHICRKWRHIVFASQQALHLRLFCTHGTPVLKYLDSWPALPIVVHFGGAPALNSPGVEDEDNIMVALKYSDRVSSIDLAITSSLLEKLSAIEKPFPELEDLVLLSQGSMQMTFPSAFRWGLRLRTLHLTRVAIPALPELLSSSTGLVDLQLHKIPHLGYFSPEAFADALSGMTQLRILSLCFHSLARRESRMALAPSPQSRERAVLPALTFLKYRGTSKYLDSFVARIDAPRLRGIYITFFSQPMMAVSQLGRFINRIDMRNSHCRAEIISSERAISISFTPPEAPTRLEVQVSCKSLTQRLSYMALICNSLLAFLLGVEHLRINATQPSNGNDNSDRKQWVELIHPFRGAKWVHIAGNHSTSIVLALPLPHSEMRHKTVLPALQKLCIGELEARCAPLREAVVSFMQSCRLSGHIIKVEYERLWTNELHGTGTAFVQYQFITY